MNFAAAIVGARVRRIDGPLDGMLSLELAGPQFRGALLVSTARGARGVGLCERRPQGTAADAFVQALRRRLTGTRLTAITLPGPRVVALRFEREGRTQVLFARMSGEGNLILCDAEGTLLTARRRLAQDDAPDAPGPATGRPVFDGEASVEEMLQAGAQLVSGAADAALEAERAPLRRALAVRSRQLRRRLEAIEGDAARAPDALTLRKHASLLLAHLHALGDRDDVARVTDYEQDPPRELELRIDPRLGPKQQAEAWFTRARKLERGAKIAAERSAATQRELSATLELAAALDGAATRVEIAEIVERARALGVVPQAAPATARTKSAARLTYREFIGDGGRTILVGRGAADNDRLTLDHARPHDLWLHVREGSGAHVVVPLDRGEACPPQLLCDAATLAAHFSQLRDQATADVIYTARRYVRKPRKSPPGRMLVEREKVFRLRVEPDRLRRLMAAEVRHGAN